MTLPEILRARTREQSPQTVASALWEVKTPTGILTAYNVDGQLRLVLVYNDDNGYEVFRPSTANTHASAARWLLPANELQAKMDWQVTP